MDPQPRLQVMVYFPPGLIFSFLVFFLQTFMPRRKLLWAPLGLAWKGGPCVLHEFQTHPLKASIALLYQLTSTINSQHERLPRLPGPPAGAVGGSLVCHALQGPAHQTRGVHAGGNGDHHSTRHQASPGAHHHGPHLTGCWQLRGHWDVRGVWPGGQGNGRTWCYSVLHHCSCCIHIIR